MTDTFFVDANIVVYAATAGRYREACSTLLDAIADGEAGGRMSTAVLEEIWHLELSGKAGPLAGLAASAYATFTPLLPVTDETVELALSLDASPLGANDRIHLATCRLHHIEAIVTADAGFDHVRGIARVDPLDLPAISDLLGS